MTDKDKIKKLKSLDVQTYNSIDLDRLVIYATVELASIGVELSLENIIVGTFKFFPKKFSLVGFPEFPDATRVEKCLWRCKGKKRQWIGGKTQHGYQITDTSKVIAEQTKAELSNTTVGEKQKVLSQTRRKELLIAELERSPAYAKYLKQQYDLISEADLCYLLQGTLDSSHTLLAKNFASLHKVLEELERRDIIQFLNWLGNHFKNFLNNSST